MHASFVKLGGKGKCISAAISTTNMVLIRNCFYFADNLNCPLQHVSLSYDPYVSLISHTITID